MNPRKPCINDFFTKKNDYLYRDNQYTKLSDILPPTTALDQQCFVAFVSLIIHPIEMEDWKGNKDPEKMMEDLWKKQLNNPNTEEFNKLSEEDQKLLKEWVKGNRRKAFKKINFAMGLFVLGCIIFAIYKFLSDN